MNSHPLKLTAKSYPTNAPAASKFKEYTLKDNQNYQIRSGILKTETMRKYLKLKMQTMILKLLNLKILYQIE